MLEKFEFDVKKGLTSHPKSIPSKFIYDEVGKNLFEEILNLEEYYVPSVENEIISIHAKEITGHFLSLKKLVNFIELGPGNGKKIIKLLSNYSIGNEFLYTPVDISQDFLRIAEEEFKKKFPKTQINKQQLDYVVDLDEISVKKESINVLLFFGSSLGNLLVDERVYFFNKLSHLLKEDDLVLIGFDLIKSPIIIFKAYYDIKGITALFNLNLLKRINNELNADFNTFQFEYFPTYSPLTGEVNSYLVSKRKQTVTIKNLNLEILFEEHEPIFTEVSKKFRIEEIDKLANQNGFSIIKNYYDQKLYYSLSLWRKD